jgi:hypothetical protein
MRSGSFYIQGISSFQELKKRPEGAGFLLSELFENPIPKLVAGNWTLEDLKKVGLNFEFSFASPACTARCG